MENCGIPAALAAFTLIFAAFPAAAAETRPYLGVGYAHVDHEGGADDFQGVSVSFNDTSSQGFILRGGLGLSELVDLEADYGRTSGDYSGSVSRFSASGDFDYQSWGAHLLLNLQTGAFIEPFFRVGHRWIEVDGSLMVGGGVEHGSDDIEDIVFGAGFRGNVADDLFMRFDYEWIDEDGGWIIGLEYHF